jgi:uncharacterized Zn-binding protein involved in type VI secretion
MPAPVLHLGATVLCGHGGQAIPTAPVGRVLVSGQPVATLGPPYSVAGCPFANAPGPCVTGSWVVGSLRVKAMGMPLAIQSGVAVCVPNGAPLLAVAAQPRVIAT